MNRYLAMAGLGSRRTMDDLIASGTVEVNGIPVRSMGVQVHPDRDRVSVDGREIILGQRHVYILLNKPKDTITTLRDEKGRRTILDYVKVKQRVFPVGRLDRNTTGVLLLTNDGTWANELIHPRTEVERIYKVTTADPMTQEQGRRLAGGVRLDDGMARAAEVWFTDKQRKKVFVTMTEGRNREVRRMFEALGHDVRQLDRVAFGGLTAKGLPRGAWRFLRNDEVIGLRAVAAGRGRPARKKGSGDA